MASAKFISIAVRPTLCLLLLAAGSRTRALSAQTANERAALESFRRSPRGPWVDSFKTNDRSFNDLVRGFWLLDEADATRSTANTLQALDRFYEVTIHRPRWPYGWYGLGLTKLALYRSGLPETRSSHQPAGAGWLAMAGTAFTQALAVDSAFSPAAVGLAQVLLSDLDAPGTNRAFAAIARHARLVPPDTSTSLALARLSAAHDSFAAATEALGRYLALGGDSGVAMFELASSRFGAGDNAAAATFYYSGAAYSGKGPASELYNDDLSLVGDTSEVAEFSRLPSASRPEWLRRFWSRREVEAGRPAGTRLTEHFRRVRYAKRHFAVQSASAQYSFEQIYRGAPRGLDDRGVIYIRHGAPDDRATMVGTDGTYPNESWLYFRSEGNLIFHFAALRNTGFRLVENLLVIVPHRDSLPPDVMAQIFESRGGMDLEYLQLASLFELDALHARGPTTSSSLVNPNRLVLERQRNRDMIALGTTTDSDPVSLERSWTPTTQVFGTTTGLLVAIALPAPEDLHPIPLPSGGVGYTLRLRTTAANDQGETTLDVDSMVRLRTPRPLRPGEFLNIVRAYNAPAGTQRVRVVLADSTGARGAVRVLNGVPVIDLQSDSLALSD